MLRPITAGTIAVLFLVGCGSRTVTQSPEFDTTGGGGTGAARLVEVVPAPATPPTAVVDDVELDILSSEWVTPDGLKSVHPTDQSGVATLTRVTIDAAVVDLRILTTATPTRLEVAQFTDIGPTGVPAGESGTIDCLAPTATCRLDDSTQQEIRALITPGSATKALVIQAGFSVDPRSVKRLTRRTPLSSSVSWGFLYDHGA